MLSRLRKLVASGLDRVAVWLAPELEDIVLKGDFLLNWQNSPDPGMPTVDIWEADVPGKELRYVSVQKDTTGDWNWIFTNQQGVLEMRCGHKTNEDARRHFERHLLAYY